MTDDEIAANDWHETSTRMSDEAKQIADKWNADNSRTYVDGFYTMETVLSSVQIGDHWVGCGGFAAKNGMNLHRRFVRESDGSIHKADNTDFEEFRAIVRKSEPRQAKAYVRYHYDNFIAGGGNAVDFLDHIEYELLPAMSGTPQYAIVMAWLQQEKTPPQNSIVTKAQTPARLTEGDRQTQLVKLRDTILEIPAFAGKLAELERFCIDNKVGCLSQLSFHEWGTNEYGDSKLYQNLVPMKSNTVEELAAFRDWAIDYYKRTNPMATVDGRIQRFEAKAAKAPDRIKLVEAELRKTQDEHTTYCGGYPGHFALGQKYAREGDAPDFLDYNAYSPQVSQILLGYANFHYLLFLERGQNSIAAKAQAPAIMESHEVRQLYRKVLEIPELASTLNPYQKAELKKMADSDILEALYFVNAYLPANPGQVYPPQYVGREVDYWLEIGHSAGAEATRMRKILASPTPADSQPQNSIATKDQPPASSDLENYLTDTGKPIVPFILTNYKKAKPQSITALFFAMKDLGMCGEPSSLDCTKLHNDLKAELGIAFVRQALSKSINDFNKGGKEPLVNAAKTGIRNYLAILATR